MSQSVWACYSLTHLNILFSASAHRLLSTHLQKLVPLLTYLWLPIATKHSNPFSCIGMSPPSLSGSTCSALLEQMATTPPILCQHPSSCSVFIWGSHWPMWLQVGDNGDAVGKESHTGAGHTPRCWPFIPRGFWWAWLLRTRISPDSVDPPGRTSSAPALAACWDDAQVSQALGKHRAGQHWSPTVLASFLWHWEWILIPALLGVGCGRVFPAVAHTQDHYLTKWLWDPLRAHGWWKNMDEFMVTSLLQATLTESDLHRQTHLWLARGEIPVSHLPEVEHSRAFYLGVIGHSSFSEILLCSSLWEKWKRL